MSDGYADMAIRGIGYLRNFEGTFEEGCRFSPKAGSHTPLAMDSDNQSQVYEIGCTEIGRKMWLLIIK